MKAAGGWENVKGKEHVFWAWPTLDVRPSFAALRGAETLNSVGLCAGGRRNHYSVGISMEEVGIIITLN